MRPSHTQLNVLNKFLGDAKLAIVCSLAQWHKYGAKFFTLDKIQSMDQCRNEAEYDVEMHQFTEMVHKIQKILHFRESVMFGVQPSLKWLLLVRTKISHFLFLFPANDRKIMNSYFLLQKHGEPNPLQVELKKVRIINKI